eukprot:6392316-Amphidinium_carterae.1
MALGRTLRFTHSNAPFVSLPFAMAQVIICEFSQVYHWQSVCILTTSIPLVACNVMKAKARSKSRAKQFNCSNVVLNQKSLLSAR